MIKLAEKPRINNVVCTADLRQFVDITKISELSCGIYDEAIYGGICGYIKIPQMKGKVAIFSTGKMISTGGKSSTKAIEQLAHAKFLLLQENIISDVKLQPQIRNIVATLSTSQKLPLKSLSSKIPGSKYDPDVFPAMILKREKGCTFSIFASGKIVITGAKSESEINNSTVKLIQKLNKLMKE